MSIVLVITKLELFYDQPFYIKGIGKASNFWHLKISSYTIQATITTVVLGGLTSVESPTGFVLTELIYLDGTTCPVEPYVYYDILLSCIYMCIHNVHEYDL